jgi:hypothetical protein
MLDAGCWIGMEDGGWRMEDGGWRMEDGGWRMEDGGWRMEDGRVGIRFCISYQIPDAGAL